MVENSSVPVRCEKSDNFLSPVGLIAYDTQKIKEMSAQGFSDFETESKVVVLGVPRLHLDFINLFLMPMRLFGNRRN